jgi:hypothetical protein
MRPSESFPRGPQPTIDTGSTDKSSSENLISSQEKAGAEQLIRTNNSDYAVRRPDFRTYTNVLAFVHNLR